MNLSLKSLDRICLLTIMIVAVLGGLWAVRHGLKQRTQVGLENSLYLRSITKINRAESSIQYLKTVLKATRSESKALKARIPEAAEIGKFLKQLDFRIQQRKIALITLQPMTKVKEQYFTKIPVRLIFKGAFIDIYNLLHDLETMDRMLAAETLTISKSGFDEQCRGELIVNIFEH